ncbi:MAG: hypothetical protein ONB46_20065 [candidate division KSB1 bacterium]|nr:hypothetical protein [candidate division KSB1 bacterium]MDZ7368764.1 hypothetical protein [candidate division KSB1 bacterium]MDZ7406419.1 hypothetical protein [candidate division KSB1 bacterium]
MHSCNRWQSRIAFVGLLLPAVLWAQPESIKWGEVPRADLEMKVFPDDTNAAAVILGDVGNVYFNERLEMVLRDTGGSKFSRRPVMNGETSPYHTL